MKGTAIRGDRRGGMPFALAAVAILLSVTAYGAVQAEIEGARDGAEDSWRSVKAIDSAADGITAFIEQGMGENVRSVSLDPDAGGLDGRRAEFSERMERWMGSMFPAEDSGVLVKLKGWTAELNVEDLRTQEGLYAADGYTPAYLYAAGTADLTFESDSGKAHRTVELRADGSCALPLAIERGTLFESLLKGNGSMMSQMMQYQLSSLAQSRIMSGYGAYVSGEKGTDSVITAEDVKEAYSTVLRAAESIVFRDADGEIVGGTRDIGMDLVRSRGGLTVDLSGMYSQIASASMDRLIGKWFDYFLGSEIISALDGVADTLADAWDSLVSFLTNKKTDYSAAPYIKEVTGRSDFSVRGSFELRVPSPAENMGEVSITVPYPEADLLHYGTVDHFKKTYRADTDGLMEWITSVANGALAQIAEAQSMGTAAIQDRGSFADSVRAFAEENASRCDADFLKILTAQVRAEGYPDPFYTAIYRTIEENRADIWTTDPEAILRDRLPEIRGLLVSAYSEAGADSALAESYADAGIASLTTAAWNLAQFREYSDKVDAEVAGLSALCEVEKKSSAIIQKGCAKILRLPLIATSFDTEKRFAELAEEFAQSVGADPFEGLREYGKEGTFELLGDASSFEKLTVETDSRPSVSIARNSGSSSHCTDLCTFGADFCSVFSVEVNDTVTYSVTGSGPLQSRLGTGNCVFRASVPVSLKADVPVVSGWPLSGFEYSATDTITEDAWKKLAEWAGELADPLISYLRTVGELGERLAGAVMEIVRDSGIVREIYELIGSRTEMLGEAVEKILNDSAGKVLESLTGEVQEIIDIKASSQTVGIGYMGWKLTFTVYAKNIDKSSKDLLKIGAEGTLGGSPMKAWLTVSQNSSGYKVHGGFGYTGDGWGISGTFNPSMYRSDRILTVDGHYGDTEVSISFPEVQEYRRIDVRLSDIPGMGTVLSNLPSPVPGTLISVDAGAELKYNVPMEEGLLINEAESNPAGEDKGSEWVELLNFSRSEISLDGMSLRNSRGATWGLSGTIGPMEHKVVTFPVAFLNNSGEKLELLAADGSEIGHTPKFSDSANDSTTYQRTVDGCTQWKRGEGSPGEKNSGLFDADGYLLSSAKDIVKDAALEAIDEAGHVTDMDGLSLLCKKITQKVMDKVAEDISGMIVGARLFAECRLHDASGTACTGFQAYIEVDRGTASDALKLLMGRAAELLLHIDDPYKVSIADVALGDVYIGAEAFAGIGVPKFIDMSGSPETSASIDVNVNAEAVSNLLGHNSGAKWKVNAGIVVRDCPASAVSFGSKYDSSMKHDLWLMRMTVSGK